MALESSEPRWQGQGTPQTPSEDWTGAILCQAQELGVLDRNFSARKTDFIACHEALPVRVDVDALSLLDDLRGPGVGELRSLKE